MGSSVAGSWNPVGESLESRTIGRWPGKGTSGPAPTSIMRGISAFSFGSSSYEDAFTSSTDLTRPAVTLSAGSPVDVCNYLMGKGVKSLAVVPNVANAVKSEKAGVDAIIAEGTESGGVQGRNGVSTLVLVPMVVEAVRLPVLAAGGIGDARGFRAALALGAKGVQIGTRFIASRECIAHAKVKAALCQAQETETILFAQSQRTLSRVLRTPLVEKILEAPDTFDREMLHANQWEAWFKGNLDLGFVSFGQVAGLIKEIKSVKAIIEEMVS